MFEDMGLTVRESRSYPVFEIKAVPGSERNWHSEAFKFDDYEHAVIVMREENCEPFLEDFDLNPRADLIQYLEGNGWEGPDASITISLYEYGYLFKDFGDGDWGVIHYDVRREKSSYGLPNCSKRLAFAVLDSDEIEDWEDEYCEEAEELTGLSHEEWSDLYTPSKLMDMNSIVGMLWEIFYGAYKLTEKEMLSFLREDVNG
jgi:hypothetical protein